MKIIDVTMRIECNWRTGGKPVLVCQVFPQGDTPPHECAQPWLFPDGSPTDMLREPEFLVKAMRKFADAIEKWACVKEAA